MNDRSQNALNSSYDDELLITEVTPARSDAAAAALAGEAPRRRVLVPVLLFLATCASAFIAGMSQWFPGMFLTMAARGNGIAVRQTMLAHGADGLVYMGGVIGILLTHEMGHFLMTIRYRVPSTLPFFLPMPWALFGTMGAVIAMDGRRANRKEIFDIGIAGPLAGLVVAVPVLLLGVAWADFTLPSGGGIQFDIPLAIHWLLHWMQPHGYEGQNVIWLSQMNPLLMAGWFGLLITGLNMAPVGQLDGGHVIYTLFGPNGRWIARGFVLVAIAFITLTGTYIWAVMLMLVVLVLGVDHPPTSDDNVPIGRGRFLLGVASLAIPILCLPPAGLWVVG